MRFVFDFVYKCGGIGCGDARLNCLQGDGAIKRPRIDVREPDLFGRARADSGLARTGSSVNGDDHKNSPLTNDSTIF